MNHYKRIGLYGISGVGKSTLIKEIVKSNIEVHHMDGTSYVLKAAGMNLHDFKNLPETEKYRIREKAIEIAFEDQIIMGKDFLIAGHMAFPADNGGFINIITQKDIEFYTEFIYMNIPPKLIFERQNSDTKNRQKYPLPTIESWQNFELGQIKNICRECKTPLRFLETTNLNESIEALKEMIRA